MDTDAWDKSYIVAMSKAFITDFLLVVVAIIGYGLFLFFKIDSPFMIIQNIMALNNVIFHTVNFIVFFILFLLFLHFEKSSF